MRRRALLLAVSTAALAAACSRGGEAPVVEPEPPGPAAEPTPSPGSPSSAEPTGEASPPGGRVRVRLEPVASLTQPLAMATRVGDPALYVGQKTGQVVALPPGGGEAETVLDLSSEVSRGSEQGLLGIAFSPDGGFLYVNLTDPAGDTRVLEFAVRGGRPDPGSRREVLFVDQPFGNHNGGHLAFGPDGYLYIGLGDGGAAGDPLGAAQDLGRRLGKMLRIDPRPADGRGFAVPPDNPFVGQAGALPAIWAYGLRNPWRYSFDRETGDLWIADVGQDRREEIDLQPADSGGGENYGWDRLEGTLPFEGEPPPDAVPPVYEYGRDVGGTVIGGYVYRGAAIPGLRGAYVFGDLFNPELMALRRDGGEVRVRPLGVQVETLVSFGEDQDGELYALSLSGEVFRIVPA